MDNFVIRKHLHHFFKKKNPPAKIFLAGGYKIV